MPPKIDKSHGFMQSIIKNQVLRDEYDKQQKLTASTKETEAVNDSENMSSSSREVSKRSRTPRRAAVQLYIPPHVKTKDEPSEPSPKNSPEPTKRPTKEPSTNIRELKRTRQSTPTKTDTSSYTRTLFKFEYEDDSGEVRTLFVQEDDNAEDLAEMFGNQLGLTKSLKKALKQKLSNEIKSCLNH